MALMRASMQFLYLGVALGMPLASMAQTAMVVPPAATPQPAPLPPATQDVSKPLEGRLFFSPQQRLQIDTARRRGFVTGEDGQLVETPPPVLNGFVKRSDGNTAVWVDGDVRWNGQSKYAVSLVPSDVGGPAQYVQATSADTVRPASPQTTQSKRAATTRTRKHTKPKLLP